MFYHYIASDKSGKIVESDLEADSLSQVLQYLGGKELRPVSVKPLREGALGKTRLFGRINLTDKIFLTKYLALMLRVGTDLLSAINILIADFDKPAVKDFLLEVRDNLSRGQPFYKAFGMHPKIFNATFVNLVKAAETSGNLQQAFENLSESLINEGDLRGRIQSAVIYPLILLATAVAIVVFLVTFALPKIAKVFEDSGITPPFFSRMVFGIGLFVENNIFIIFGIFFAALTAALYSYYRTDIGKRLFDGLLTNIPFIRGISRDLAIQRMSSTMSSLMKAGLPIIDTITVTADTVGIIGFRYALLRIANEGLAKGLTIGESFKRETVFPKAVTNLIAISEKAGHLEEVLKTLADFYGANISSSIKSLVAVLEPVMLLIMGMLVATIALSIIVPIYQLTTQF
jgi:type II secretory pathway component PulF